MVHLRNLRNEGYGRNVRDEGNINVCEGAEGVELQAFQERPDVQQVEFEMHDIHKAQGEEIEEKPEGQEVKEREEVVELKAFQERPEVQQEEHEEFEMHDIHKAPEEEIEEKPERQDVKEEEIYETKL